MLKVVVIVGLLLGVGQAFAEDYSFEVISRDADTSAIDGDLIFVAEDLVQNAQAEEVLMFKEQIAELGENEALVVQAKFGKGPGWGPGKGPGHGPGHGPGGWNPPPKHPHHPPPPPPPPKHPHHPPHHGPHFPPGPWGLPFPFPPFFN